MIARIWRGATATRDADAYAAYIEETGISEYRSTPGNVSAMLLRRTLGETTEFITFSLWESLDAIRAFAGDDPERAVYYPEDERFLITRDETVTHYEVSVA
jgi:heme-degrading monooxygenase HmoA